MTNSIYRILLKSPGFLLLGSTLLLALALPAHSQNNASSTGNVIFIHPDGSSYSMWTAMRVMNYGLDGMSNWDRLDRIGLYRSHVLNSTNASSHGGATVHAYGAKVQYDTYGNTESKPVKALSGSGKSIMHEAIDSGLATALINSGHICEPGTGVFVASAPRRSMTDEISEQVIRSGVDIIFSGGEVLMLPQGEIGLHGEAGKREDGKNLIEIAQNLGYQVVYNRDAMFALPDTVSKVLGVFAAYHTFHDKSEEYLAEYDLPLYEPDAPTVGEMARKAFKMLTAKKRRFLMVIEEEGTDNFANSNNAKGTLEALRRADLCIGEALDFVNSHPNTLIVTAADSDAGGMQMYSLRDSESFDRPLPKVADNAAPLDGRDGTATPPFVTAPDKHGVRLHFGIVWSCYEDVAGGIIARAHGLNADLMESNVDNTDIYRLMYTTLFGRKLPPYSTPN